MVKRSLKWRQKRKREIEREEVDQSSSFHHFLSTICRICFSDWDSSNSGATNQHSSKQSSSTSNTVSVHQQLLYVASNEQIVDRTKIAKGLLSLSLYVYRGGGNTLYNTSTLTFCFISYTFANHRPAACLQIAWYTWIYNTDLITFFLHWQKGRLPLPQTQVLDSHSRHPAD